VDNQSFNELSIPNQLDSSSEKENSTLKHRYEASPKEEIKHKKK